MPSWPVMRRPNWFAGSSFWNDPALQVRVGVHSGYVVAHVIEADFSSIYEAGGPAVHLVKRLESAAQAGQILVSESCQSLSAGLVTFQRSASEAAGGIFRTRSLLRARRNQRAYALAGPLDQGTFVVCRPRGRDFPARAGGAGCRFIRTDHRAGGNGRHRKIPNGPRVRRRVAAEGLAGPGSGRQPAGAGRSLCAAEEAAAERAAGRQHHACGSAAVARGSRHPRTPIFGQPPFAPFWISPSRMQGGTISNPCCGGGRLPTPYVTRSAGLSRRDRPSCCWRIFTGSTVKARPRSRP